jgi:hypothetical protein
MEGFLVPKTVLGRARAEERTSRRTYNSDEISAAVKYARLHGVNKASKKFKLPYTTVKTWCDKKETPQPKKRGRPRFFNDATEAEAVQYVDAIRGEGGQVTEHLVCSVSRGIQERDCALLLEENGGTRIFSKQHARSLLARSGFAPRGATTDRTIPASDLRHFGGEFLSGLQTFAFHHPVSQRNTYNFDEFFCLLDGDTKRWSWHRTSQKHHVAVRATKLGLTCGILTSASGDVVLVQLNWCGTTERSTAQVLIQRNR